MSKMVCGRHVAFLKRPPPPGADVMVFGYVVVMCMV